MGGRGRGIQATRRLAGAGTVGRWEAVERHNMAPDGTRSRAKIAPPRPAQQPSTTPTTWVSACLRVAGKDNQLQLNSLQIIATVYNVLKKPDPRHTLKYI